MKLNKIKETAGKILKKGKHKLVINLEKFEENKKQVTDAITRSDVKDIISKGIIDIKKNTGQSRGRARDLLEKKKLKRKKGPGKKKGTLKARQKDNVYNLKVRGLRKRLKELKKEDKLNDKNYKKLYLMIKGNYFRGKKHLEEYINGENK
ncbi:MAG: 50S ribosomal protein L19e [Candidatus ainarchaeum sp.]|nr:50S ribosomal protein L19e [Candidatus ainarchaeum sp.]MDD3975764.1 50S ribosomal protein L19e [Candidatus ainarchaeum sp.]